MDNLHKTMLALCPAGIACHRSICDNLGNPLDYEFVEVNPAFEAITGFRAETIIGKRITEIFPDDQFNWLSQYPAVASGGNREYQRYCGSSKRWYKVNVYSPSPNHFATVITDVTEEVKALALAKQKAEEAAAAKAQFLANMSHELRTPLNSIIGMADLLSETQLTDTQWEFIRVFKTAGQTLLNLVDDILDISKMDSGKLELESQPFNLPELVSKTVELMSVRAAQKNLAYACSIDPQLPEWVRGDQERLQQVLLNLLGNAIKFTDRGRVSVQVSSIEEITNSPNEVGLLFAISDTGQGIPKDSLRHIFDEFYQVDSSLTRVNQGSGLGLAISKKLVNLMGGSIWVESVLGEGSTFYFTVRPEEAATAHVLDRYRHDLSGASPLKILLVEDSQDNRFIIQHYMKTTPHELDIAVNGQMAVAKAESSQYDLILMDIQMPVMDGYTATKEIRAWEASNAKQPVPIVALTAYSLEEEVKKMLSSGFDAHLSKPIKKATLLNYIGQYATA